MTKVEDIKRKADVLRKQLATLDKITGAKGEALKKRDLLRKREERADGKDVAVPACADRERRELLESDDEEWLLYYFAPESETQDAFTYQFTSQQKIMIAAIRNAILNGEDQAIAATRGEGKTTYCERLLLKYTLQGIVTFAVLFQATGGAAEDSLECIKNELEKNVRLLEDYPEVCVPVRALEDTPNRAHYQTVSGQRHDNGEAYSRQSSKFSWCGQEIYFPAVPGSPSSSAIFATRGLDSSYRGVKKKGRRPSICIIDDPDTDESAASDLQATKLERRIDRAIAGLGSQKKRVARVMLTTIQSRTSVSYKFTDPLQKPSWHGKRFRFLIKKPNRETLWDEYILLKQDDWRNGTNKAHELYASRRADMDEGSEVANPNRLDPGNISALQFYYDQVARLGREAVLTEYDNEPPDDTANKDALVLSSYHIQNSCSSGLDKRIIPPESVAITIGGDVQKLGLHYVVIATNEVGASVIVDYGFFEFRTEGRKAADCELLILEGLFYWQQDLEDNPFQSLDGGELFADLSLIDTGWKEESWTMQPVQSFCAQVGYSRFMPSKGFSPYQRPRDSRKVVIGDNWHVAWPNGQPIVETNPDHWKLKVHEGFLAEHGQPGSIRLFDPPLVEGRRSRTGHLSYSKHILSETWETRFTPGFKRQRTGWWKIPGKQNHYLDATYQALVARSMRGISVLPAPPVPEAAPITVPQAQPLHVIPFADQRRRW